MVKDCSHVKIQVKGNIKSQSRAPSYEAPKRNHFYALNRNAEQENSRDVVIGMLPVFYVNVYALLDLGATIYFFKTFGI